MGFFKLLMILVSSVALQLLLFDIALAWGPAVHTVTALSVLDNVSMLLPSISGVLASYPLEYLYGCLAADFFIGKSKTGKRGHPHNWEGGFRFLGKAGDEREAAFTYGFLSHLAADVVAHNFFVPRLMVSYADKRRMGHLYWEVKADYLVGPSYIKIARDVLSMDHRGSDQLLRLIAGKRRKRLNAKKRIFTQSVRLSDYLYEAHPVFFAGKVVHLKDFRDYLALMVGVSCRVVRDFLQNPQTAPCLRYDPMGKRNLRSARRERSMARSFNARRPARFIRERVHFQP